MYARTDQDELGEKLDDFKKRNPCPSCCHNLKVFQAKVKASEARAIKAEQSRDKLILKNAGLVEKIQIQFDEIQELKFKVREMSWQPSHLQQLLDKFGIKPPE